MSRRTDDEQRLFNMIVFKIPATDAEMAEVSEWFCGLLCTWTLPALAFGWAVLQATG